MAELVLWRALFFKNVVPYQDQNILRSWVVNTAKGKSKKTATVGSFTHFFFFFFWGGGVLSTQNFLTWVLRIKLRIKYIPTCHSSFLCCVYSYIANYSHTTHKNQADGLCSTRGHGQRRCSVCSSNVDWLDLNEVMVDTSGFLGQGHAACPSLVRKRYWSV